ncbi:P-loop containing nucleoside triphosphate hydrolase protein [Dunaliella salina]|uniref:P-loop containing nucleoside triphosphate hydrolase protein n=1 Tax=Dunaliella salina TaxID=3046 RepID=A0ABQ7H5L8_DUNSA|nr:P-loop containing nucleoside triphosphate hydrolase protein [Dunaliella salina]|eukprot:KAF5842147.1 P-loop containing nucleoside triphosphate hydrolase protein [Dunaliella salina]
MHIRHSWSMGGGHMHLSLVFFLFKVFMLMQQQQDALSVLQFKNGSVVKMCVTSYETIRKHSTSLAGTFDLMVCDEGHRLKSVGGNKTIDALLELNCPRRVLLTGTPVQNNLQEFFALLSFVAPELLGNPQTFKRVYSDPIAKSHDRAATKEEEEIGKARESELQRKVASFMKRRTQAVLARHLPPLSNIILFCKPTPVQGAAYKEALKGVLPQLNSASGLGDSTLAAITVLRKCCNHPQLLSGTSEDTDSANLVARAPKQADTEEVSRSTDKRMWVPPGMHLGQGDNVCKMCVLDGLLDAILAAGDCVVIVSTSTSALDCINKLLLQPKGLSVKRIDGSVGVDERQSSVDSFNMGHGQVFLLSTRAGGAGLNLIGANHLVLYDSDWNPAADLQAQGRIWRDGQKKPCSIWRLLTTGTLEEKIYMRQIVKGDLASATMGAAGAATGNGSKQFSREELRQLFTLSSPDTCETKTLLEAHAKGAEQLQKLRQLFTLGLPDTCEAKGLLEAYATGAEQASMQWLDVSAGLTQAGLPAHVQQALASALHTSMVSAASIHRPAQTADVDGSA